MEFGAKLDVSIDSEEYGRLEKVSFDAYNESGCQVPSWGGCQRISKQIRNRNIRITSTGLKWNGISVGASAAMDWDVS